MRLSLLSKLFFLACVVVCCGCSLRHVSEIRRVQAVGANMDEQKKYVKEANERFEKLLAAIETNQMSLYLTQQDFLKAFGVPIFEEKHDNNKDYAELWLYRYCEKMRGSEKVYLYFDASGKLLKWEHLPAAK